MGYNVEGLEYTFKVVDETYGKIAKIPTKELFGAFLGVIIDQWNADHEIGFKEAHEFLMDIMEAHKFVNQSIGEASPHYERG